MFCPKCKDSRLKPAKLDEGLSAMGCNQCNGALVSLLYYRDWIERSKGALEAPSVELLKGFDSEDSTSALSCPKCSRLLQKFRISGCSSNRLDLCTSCDEVWLDGGEWELIKALELSQEMPMVFTEQWQKKIRNQVSDEARRERFLKIIGEDNLLKADEFRQWLKDNPHRHDILFYVNHE
ncbi:TFIIB-type zinc ribbon-containing protein [Aliikangiella sp. IMCC44359]|uniref:TFIIB-type zinc ribbon-containing protein n=1 Tax=Aliikangiella sp. IMCC44359 TaxID=3459125 RepID=UPI00403AA7A3